MGIREVPHYELPAAELAAWIEKQGPDHWWNVDGDSVLTGRIPFPSPGDELAEELRRLNKNLLIQDRQKSPDAKGQPIGCADLDVLADRLGNNIPFEGEKPTWVDDRFFLLCWKDSNEEWLLVEDQETTEETREDLAFKGND